MQDLTLLFIKGEVIRLQILMKTQEVMHSTNLCNSSIHCLATQTTYQIRVMETLPLKVAFSETTK